MSRVPLLYFSRGQLESVDWLDPVVELAAVALIGETRSAPITIAHGSKEALINFIRVWTKTSLLLPWGRWQ